MLKKQIAVTAIALFIAFLASSTHAAVVNGFANGGLELPGTTTVAEAWLPAASGYTISNDARTGLNSAQLMSPALNAAVMLQNSVNDGMQPILTPGDTPMLSFWSKGFAGSTGNVLFALRYLDNNGAILANSGNQFFQTSINPTTWTEITYNLGAVPIGAESALLEFSQAIGPIDGVTLLAGTVLIDDIHLGVVAVPEPTHYAFLVICGLLFVARRKIQKTQAALSVS